MCKRLLHVYCVVCARSRKKYWLKLKFDSTRQWSSIRADKDLQERQAHEVNQWAPDQLIIERLRTLLYKHPCSSRLGLQQPLAHFFTLPKNFISDPTTTTAPPLSLSLWSLSLPKSLPLHEFLDPHGLSLNLDSRTVTVVITHPKPVKRNSCCDDSPPLPKSSALSF